MMNTQNAQQLLTRSTRPTMQLITRHITLTLALISLIACETTPVREPLTLPQAGEPQAGEPQAGEPQAGEPQAGEPQAGEPQAGEPQAGEPQAGGSEGGMSVGEPTPEPTPEPAPSAQPLTPEEVTEVELLAPPPPVELPHRPRRRLNLDQLDRALEQALGLVWTERQGGRDVHVLERLSGTLGKPDFIQQTVEDLTPSALFLKFLDDAARSLCVQRASLDLQRAAGEEVSALPPERDVWGPLWGELSLEEHSEAEREAQLRRLALRFHGHALPEGDSPQLAYWRWLFESTRLVSDQPELPWVALCVGMINHPDFYSY